MNNDLTFPEPNWRPLESIEWVSHGRIKADDFMYMGCIGDTIHLYKHCDTRRYLNLDEAGHAYQYVGERGYRPLRSLTEAIDHALS